MAGGQLNGQALSLTDLPLIRGGAKGEGAPKPIIANVVMLLKSAHQFFNLRYDEFSQAPFRGSVKLRDADFLDITNWTQLQGIHADLRVVTNAIMYVADECRFHQVRDYLNGLKWDGKERLDTIFIDYGGAVDTAYTRAVTGKWHIQAVARVMEPGCKADHMLILEGIQGLLKSGFFDAMGTPWFIDSVSDLRGKDARQEIRDAWIIEMAELNNLHKAEANHIKSFMTTRSDHYRDSYGRVVQDFPRQCVLAGTINPGANGYLKDPTGARRFWPVGICKKIDIGIIHDIRDQLWAEAISRYRDEESWHLTDAAVLKAAAEAQADRYEADLWQDTVAEFIEGRAKVTTQEILVEALSLTAKADWGRAEEMRIGNILTHLGWTRKRGGVGKDRKYSYVPPVEQPQLSLALEPDKVG